MAIEIFLAIDGIQGDMQDKALGSVIAVQSFSWGVSHPSTVGTGTGAGKVQIQDLAVVKTVDAASPRLFQACATGQLIKQAVLTVRRPGTTAFDFVSAKLTDCTITAFAEAGSDTAGAVQETITIGFGAIQFAYTPQQANGTAGTPVQAGWNRVTNQPA